MKAVHKYTVTPEGKTEMPAGAEVLSVGVQQDVIVVWALVQIGHPPAIRRLVAVPTGYRCDDADAPTRAQFVGTVQIVDGLVFHIFDAGELPAWGN